MCRLGAPFFAPFVRNGRVPQSIHVLSPFASFANKGVPMGQAIVIPGTGSRDVLELRDKTDPTPAPGAVLIRNHAAGAVSFIDTIICRGDRPELPHMPGAEITIDAQAAWQS